MTGTHLLKRVGAVVVALATLIALPTHAAPAGAQLGTVEAVGSLTSGSELSYKFDLNVLTNAGSLVVKATIVGKKFKATFPVLTNSTLLVGSNDVSGTSVQIPSTFTGAAVMHVTATFSKKKIGSQILDVAITAPSSNSNPSSLTVSTNLYDVGFENSVTLDGSIVPTSGLAGTLTYVWSQTSGNTVALSTNGVVATSFVTDALTNFVTMTGSSNSIYYSYVAGGVTNQQYVEPEHRFGRLAGISLDNQQASEATYGFKVLVSNGSVTRTGVFTVACSLQTPAQPNIPVGVTAFYKGTTSSTNWSLVSQPAGSVTTLTHTNGLIAALRPDVEGVYVIQDNVTGKTVTNTAASWTGVQFCMICHGPGNNVNQPDIVTPWSQTEHSTMAERGVDGVLGSFYNESCFQCHTVGFNQSPAATNNNFYAVQQQLGWAFPKVLQAGNYAAMPAQLQNLANIQCENCHGPGSRHPGSPSVSLDAKVCASCHQDGTHHVYPEQWEVSPHSGGYESISDSEGFSASCARCHSPAGFISVVTNRFPAVAAAITNAAGLTAVAMGSGPLTCQVCHEPHNTFGDTTGNRHQLRVYDTVQLGNPLLTNSPTVYVGLGDDLTTANLQLTNSTITVTNAGLSAACMVCHNAREWPTQIQVSGSSINKMYYMTTTPDMSTAGEIFAGLGAYDYGQTMGNSFHTYLADCQTCHMYVLPAPSSTGVPQAAISINGVVTNVTTALYDQYANLLGSHTFEVDYQSVGANGVTNDVQNIAACNQCHASFAPTVSSFDYAPANFQNYDGNTNGAIEGVQTQTHTLMSNLATLMYATGLSNTIAHGDTIYFGGGYSTNATLAAAQRQAAWNWNLENFEGSFGVHNTQFTIRLLQSTYTDLSTNYYGDPTRTFLNAYPHAVLR
ncbi:MAG: hypothetical protein ABSA12_09715 [Verrucomicrobiia bacterium]